MPPLARPFARFPAHTAARFAQGSGFLGVPAGFFRAGAFTGVLLMIGVTLLANITKNYIIDAMARAEAITQDQVFGSPAPEMEGGTPAPETPVPGAGSGAEGKSPPSLLLPPPRGDSAGSESQLLTHLRVARAVPRFEVTGRKFEVTELCEIFLGHRVKRAYVLLLSVYMYGALWAYSAVFASSFATFFSVTSDPYLFFALLFGTIVVTCSCLDLREQIAIQVRLRTTPIPPLANTRAHLSRSQVSMSAARFIIIFLMVVTIADASRHSDEPYFVNVRPGGDHHWEWLHIGGIPYLLPVLVYSQVRTPHATRRRTAQHAGAHSPLLSPIDLPPLHSRPRTAGAGQVACARSIHRLLHRHRLILHCHRPRHLHIHGRQRDGAVQPQLGRLHGRQRWHRVGKRYRRCRRRCLHCSLAALRYE